MYLGNVKVVSINEDWIDEKEKFILEWMTHFLKEKNKQIDIAFIMFFNQLGYNWFRALSFVKELPTSYVKDHMLFRLVKDDESEFTFDLNQLQNELEESPVSIYLELGKTLSKFLVKKE